MNSLAFVLLAILGLSKLASTCNEAVCAPIVSKCTLMKSCDCLPQEGEECECCQGCVACFENEIESLFSECCSCVEGLCPERNVTEEARPDDIFEFAEPDPKIWREVVRGGFPEWETFFLPVASASGTANCSLTYQRQATSMKKCVESCRTMGAKSGRWFGESGGCCECIGHECAPHLHDDVSGPRCEGGGGGGEEDDLDLLSDSEWDQLSDAEQEQYLESLRDEVNRLESQQERRPKRDIEVGLREEIDRLASKWPSKHSSVGQ